MQDEDVRKETCKAFVFHSTGPAFFCVCPPPPVLHVIIIYIILTIRACFNPPQKTNKWLWGTAKRKLLLVQFLNTQQLAMPCPLF